MDTDQDWTKVKQNDVQCDTINKGDGTLNINSDSSISYKRRVSNYTFNQVKQSKAIEDDSSLPEFDVTLDNYDEDYDIKCNPGFYVQVT